MNQWLNVDPSGKYARFKKLLMTRAFAARDAFMRTSYLHQVALLSVSVLVTDFWGCSQAAHLLVIDERTRPLAHACVHAMKLVRERCVLRW